MKTYRRRILDDLIARRLQTAGAILVEGIKWCGKTTTCEQAAKSVVCLDEPEKREHNLLMAIGDCAYRRPEDGVIVCPLSALRP